MTALNGGSGFEPERGVNGALRVFGYQLSDSIRKGKIMYLGHTKAGVISGFPILQQFGTQTAPLTVPTFPTAVQDNIDAVYVPGAFGNNFIEYYQTTSQTAAPSAHASKGLEIGLTQTNGKVVEYGLGGNRSTNPLGYLGGTDPGVFIRATFEITSAAGMDQFGVGWRKQQNYLVPTSFLSAGNGGYSDFFLMGFFATGATPAHVQTSSDQTSSGSATVTDTSFQWSDAGVHTLEVRIKGRKVTCAINGVPLGGKIAIDGTGASITAQQTLTTPSYTFTNALQLVPMIYIAQNATKTPVYLRRLVCGQLGEDGLDFTQVGPQ